MKRLTNQLLDRKQLASLLGVHIQTISRWKKSGYLPTPVVNGRNAYWSRKQIVRWISLKQLETIRNI